MTGRVACLVTVLMNRWGILQVLFISFTKSPGGFPMYSSSQLKSPHWYQYMAPLWLTIGSLSLGETRRFLMVLPPLKPVWMPYLPQIFLMLSQRLCVGYDNVTISFDVIGDSLGTYGTLVINPNNCLTGRLVKSFLHSVQSPFRIFTLSESLPKVVHFLLEQFKTAAHCFTPIGEGVDDTKFSWKVMVAIPP